jgi:hypothetical protein
MKMRVSSSLQKTFEKAVAKSAFDKNLPLSHCSVVPK